jgi:hypothetical protein
MELPLSDRFGNALVSLDSATGTEPLDNPAPMPLSLIAARRRDRQARNGHPGTSQVTPHAPTTPAPAPVTARTCTPEGPVAQGSSVVLGVSQVVVTHTGAEDLPQVKLTDMVPRGGDVRR